MITNGGRLITETPQHTSFKGYFRRWRCHCQGHSLLANVLSDGPHKTTVSDFNISQFEESFLFSTFAFLRC